MMNAAGAAPRTGRRARPKAETKGGVRGGFSPPAPGGVRGGGEPPRQKSMLELAGGWARGGAGGGGSPPAKN